MIRERERAAMSGVVIVFVLFAVLLASVYGFVTGIRARSRPVIIFSVATFVSSVLPRAGHVQRQPERGPRPPAVRQEVRRHGEDARPAVGQSVLHEAARVAAHPQLRDRASEGERSRRQPDRDRRGRRLARCRHGGSVLRGRRLQQLRPRAERSGAAQSGDELSVRRARRGASRCAATPAWWPST